jgi:hypothetical protein
MDSTVEGGVLRGIVRRVGSVGLIVGAGALVYWLTGVLARLGRAFVDGLGAGAAITVLGAATLALGLVWVRYGGAAVLQRWGVVRTPPREERADVESRVDAGASTGLPLERRRP